MSRREPAGERAGAHRVTVTRGEPLVSAPRRGRSALAEPEPAEPAANHRQPEQAAGGLGEDGDEQEQARNGQDQGRHGPVEQGIEADDVDVDEAIDRTSPLKPTVNPRSSPGVAPPDPGPAPPAGGCRPATGRAGRGRGGPGWHLTRPGRGCRAGSRRSTGTDRRRGVAWHPAAAGSRSREAGWRGSGNVGRGTVGNGSVGNGSVGSGRLGSGLGVGVGRGVGRRRRRSGGGGRRRGRWRRRRRRRRRTVIVTVLVGDEARPSDAW